MGKRSKSDRLLRLPPKKNHLYRRRWAIIRCLLSAIIVAVSFWGPFSWFKNQTSVALGFDDFPYLHVGIEHAAANFFQWP